MAEELDFKTPTQVADEYLTELKATKPDVDISQEDSDWWIRSRVVGGLVSGVYADQRLIANDAFPQRARHDALGRALDLYLNDTFKSATVAEGNALVTGASGSSVPDGTQFVYEPNGNVYQADGDTDFEGETTVLVPIVSVVAGQSQNLLTGAELTLTSPPAGVDADASASGAIGSGRDAESDPEAAARILDFIREPIAGGKASDYEQWAIAADDGVVAASVVRFINGLGTVGVVITSGTTDIDAALDAGDAVVVEPSEDLIETVQDYIDERKPLTDCVTVQGPELVEVDVVVNVRYAQGDSSTIIAGQTLTQEELVQREIKRAIYKTPPGGRKFGNEGYLVISEIEEVMDLGLSAAPYTEGTVPILVDRQIVSLDGAPENLELESTEYPIPGTITVVDLNA